MRLLFILIALMIVGCHRAEAQVVTMHGVWDTFAHLRDHNTHMWPTKRYMVRTSLHARIPHRAPMLQGYVHHDELAGVGCLTPKMRTVWALVVAHWGRLHIVSTCRPGAMIRGTHYRSLHASGNAIDFNAPRGKKAEMVRWLHIHTLGGVMTYSNFAHIHIDVGPRFYVLGAKG